MRAIYSLDCVIACCLAATTPTAGGGPPRTCASAGRPASNASASISVRIRRPRLPPTGGLSFVLVALAGVYTSETNWERSMAGKTYVGIGGWTFEPWRGVFYPDDLTQKRELEYASRKLTSIEINGTYYSSFKRASWAKWKSDTPDGFVFSMKASRFCTNRRVLAEAKDSVERIVKQGLVELGDRLGPIN